MSTVAIVNQKGGVGKTTIAIHLAVAAARANKRVIVVDADPQGNSSSWLLDAEQVESGLFALLVAHRPLAEVVRPVRRWGLALVPGGPQTAEAMVILNALRRPFEYIAGVLAPLSRMADFIIVDMPPSQFAGFSEMLFACDWAMVPTELGRLSFEGVSLMAQTVAQLRKVHGRGPRLLAVVPNKVERTVEHREQGQDLVKTFGPVVWPPLPKSIRVSEVCTAGSVLFDMCPKEPVTLVMEQIVARFLEAAK